MKKIICLLLMAALVTLTFASCEIFDMFRSGNDDKGTPSEDNASGNDSEENDPIDNVPSESEPSESDPSESDPSKNDPTEDDPNDGFIKNEDGSIDLPDISFED